MNKLLFTKSKVEYASHQLSLWYGKCPHNCRYCYVERLYGEHGRKYAWALGKPRLNQRVFDIATHAPADDITCLYISFTNDCLPRGVNQNIFELVRLLKILQERKINTRILSKNAEISELVTYLRPSPYLTIGMSITTNSDNQGAATFWEPNASTIVERLAALIKLQQNGYHVWVSAEPLLPETNFEQLCYELSLVNADDIWIGHGNYDPLLEKAFDWNDVIQQLQFYSDVYYLRFRYKDNLRQYISTEDK